MSEENNIQNEIIEQNNDALEQENQENDISSNDNVALDEENQQEEPAEQEELTEEEIEELEQASNEGRKLNGVQKKINKFCERAKTAEEQLAIVQAENEALKASKIEPEKPLVRPIKPDELDYDDTNDYLHAHAKYEDELIAFGKKSAEIEARKAQEIQPKLDNYSQTLKKANEINPNFQRDLESLDKVGAVYSDELRQCLIDSEHGALLLNELAKDAKKAAEITKLAKTDLGKFYREIGKIEAKLSLENNRVSTGLKKQQPKPITPVSSAGGIVKNIETMTSEEYATYMRKKGSKVF